jgi:hypothetical protein
MHSYISKESVQGNVVTSGDCHLRTLADVRGREASIMTDGPEHFKRVMSASVAHTTHII